jgi:hypothetical protein
MTNQTSEMPLGKLERDFNEMKLRGDDFFKIELLRQARNCYKKAMDLNPKAGDVQLQIAECNRLLAFEIKVVRILLGITALAILIYLLVSQIG